MAAIQGRLLADLTLLRRRKGLSATAAADQMGLKNNQLLLAAERGESTPRPENALKIAKFYDLEVDEVWDFDLEPEKEAA